MVLIDSHVHIYPCFNLPIFLESAYSNFKENADRVKAGTESIPVLNLVEPESSNYFEQFAQSRRGCGPSMQSELGEWTADLAEDNLSIWMRHWPNRKLLLVAGRQIVTQERLEVLALFSPHVYKHGMPINQTLCEIQERNGIAVLPWSPGKWFGERGKSIQAIINAGGIKPLFLGDIKGRPRFWPAPSQFALAAQKGIRVLPGTDPLNFVEEQTVAGSFGFFLEGDLDPVQPGNQLRQLIISGRTEIKKFGKRLGMVQFLKNQYRLRSRQR